MVFFQRKAKVIRDVCFLWIEGEKNYSFLQIKYKK